jgi:predicted Rossmann fold flavoprotein
MSSPGCSSFSAWDVLVVGAGAAGLATAIFTRLRNPELTVVVLDGAKKPGAKILVSGGGRCNVTNASVTERDYWGGPAAVIRRVLRGLTVPETVRFFHEAGVPLHEEERGKLFPDSNSARQVLAALLAKAAASGVELRPAHRVTAVRQTDGGFSVATSAGQMTARRVVCATGGQSLPKSGSDGGGYVIAQSLGHTIVPTTPALAPLMLGDGRGGTPLHAALSGVAIDVTLTVWIDGAARVRLAGPMLWTHFGISGPAALDASRHWLRARLEQRPVALTGNFAGGMTFEAAEELWIQQARLRPRAAPGTILAAQLPASVAAALLDSLGIDAATPLASLTRETRRHLAHALTAWPLPVSDSRGYNFAEATAGGVDLTEIDPRTMESRRCRGFFLVGEVLDVDGRLGGFNFQWAWSSAAVAARGLSAPQG